LLDFHRKQRKSYITTTFESSFWRFKKTIRLQSAEVYINKLEKTGEGRFNITENFIDHNDEMTKNIILRPPRK
jgi:hypothetical protein